MIALHKNDKIIILAAVVVLILAGVGIALYTQPETTPPSTGENLKNIYVYEWQTRTISMPKITEFADKKTAFETTTSFEQYNLKSITFNVSWVDDRTSLFGLFGLDTFSLKITDPDRNSYEDSARSMRRTRQGNIELTVSVNEHMNATTTIEADSQDDAQRQLEEQYYKDKWVKELFSIEINVHIGEKRILKKIMDRGNEFDLDISYEYFIPNLIEHQETKETGSDFDDLQDEESPPPYLSLIIRSGCSRYW